MCSSAARSIMHLRGFLFFPCHPIVFFFFRPCFPDFLSSRKAVKMCISRIHLQHSCALKIRSLSTSVFIISSTSQMIMSEDTSGSSPLRSTSATRAMRGFQMCRATGCFQTEGGEGAEDGVVSARRQQVGRTRQAFDKKTTTFTCSVWKYIYRASKARKKQTRRER